MNPTPEQLKDPAWWDANAPEGAEWFCNETDSDAAAWYKETQDGFRLMIYGENRWFKSGSLDNCAIPRPTHPAWTGSGLPPVGVVCETLRQNGWTKCTIVNHVRSVGIIEAIYTYIDRDGDAMWYFSHLPSNFRPLKTHKQRVVEKAINACPYPDSGSTMRDVEALYDAGMLVDPDDSQN